MSEGVAPRSETIAKRRWWLALLLFFVAASGYLYVGRPVRYFATLAYFALLIALLFLFPGTWLSQPVVFLVLCGLAVFIALAMMVDLIRLSVQQPDYQPRWYNRWWVYVGTILIGGLLSFGPELLGGSAGQSVRTFSIPSVSGAPALQVGDYIVVNNQAYQHAGPERGDVAVFTLPRDETIVWIKRVIGLPGDRIQFKNGLLFLNGTAVSREAAGRFAPEGGPPLAQFRERLPGGRSYFTLDAGPSPGDNTAIMTVPAGHYFLLGDNRDNSSDSRFPHIGTVPRAHMLGRATGIIFADDLSRVGSKIE